MWKVLLFSALCASALGNVVIQEKDTSGFDGLVDEFIYQFTKDMKDKHEEEVKIPDFDENIEKKWSFIKVRGELTGKNGWFRDVTTLKRKGDLEVKQSDKSLALGISLGLDDMEFGFKEYSAEIWHIGVHGKITVSVADNEVYGHLSMVFNDDGTCKTTLDKIEVTKLDGFHVDMTGLGRDADWIYSYVVQFLANKYHDKISKALSDKLGPAITQALAKNDICKKIPI